MGWNSGYTIFEATVIGAYNLGKLDKALLGVLMEPFRNSDIDSGGSCDLKTHDGKGVEEVVLETWGIEVPRPPEDEDSWDEYIDLKNSRMREVTRHFGW